MPSLILVAFISLLISIPGATLVPAQQGRDEGQYTIPVDVDLVVFNVTVTDGRGRHIPGLKASDFQIREENRLQEVKLFSAEDRPASVGLIIDNSGSMAPKRSDVANAALTFVGASNPQDEMFVVTFNEKAALNLPSSISFTSEIGQMRTALLRSPPTGLTALYDALALGIEHLKLGTRERKALVVLSDGADNASRLTLDNVLALARQSTATIYTIGIYDIDDPDRNPGVLRRIAQQSGGRAYFPDSFDDLEQVWRDVAGGIRSQYTIGYQSTNPIRDGKFRKVKIDVDRRGLRVTTRDGYFAPSGNVITR